jgi:hypothetical protein
VAPLSIRYLFWADIASLNTIVRQARRLPLPLVFSVRRRTVANFDSIGSDFPLDITNQAKITPGCRARDPILTAVVAARYNPGEATFVFVTPNPGLVAKPRPGWRRSRLPSRSPVKRMAGNGTLERGDQRPFWTTTSTRRFFCLPASVSLSATGRLLPKPRVARWSAATFSRSTSQRFTASARRCERSWL